MTADGLSEQAVLPVGQYLEQARYAEADLDNGKRLALACTACHSLEPDGPTMIGPKLYGMFGTRAGSRNDYEYSRVLAEAEFTWTPRALEAWLAAPARFLPGNRMSFVGLRNEQDRADLVAYLLTATSGE